MMPTTRKSFHQKFLIPILCALAVLAPVYSLAAKEALPSSAWVSLTFSTQDEHATDWQKIRDLCTKGEIFRRLKPVSGQVRGIIVPVFDNAFCFYDTSVEPFKGRNVSADADEKILKNFLKEAEQMRVPIYLGLNLLEWHGPGLPNIFEKVPEWQETGPRGSVKYNDILYAVKYHPFFPPLFHLKIPPLFEMILIQNPELSDWMFPRLEFLSVPDVQLA